jgi:methyltransferase (TIGR00027 family)
VPASRTAQYVALYRALETTETGREPLFRDPFARAFLSPSLDFALTLARVPPLRAALVRYSDWRAPGARSSAIGRTRFIDDVVSRAAERGITQLVVLGAGYDCRAHRVSALANVRVFEVDRAEIQELKRARLETVERGVRDVTYVTVDFQVDDLGVRLGESGWKKDEPTIFIWEGVTNYLTEEAVAGVLRFVAGAAPTSLLVFTYIHRAALDGTKDFEGAQKLIENVARIGEPWRFGIEPSELEGFLRRFDLVLEEDLGADEYRQRYLRGESDFRGYAFYRIAVSSVTRSRLPEAPRGSKPSAR